MTHSITHCKTFNILTDNNFGLHLFCNPYLLPCKILNVLLLHTICSLLFAPTFLLCSRHREWWTGWRTIHNVQFANLQSSHLHNLLTSYGFDITTNMWSIGPVIQIIIYCNLLKLINK